MEMMHHDDMLILFIIVGVIIRVVCAHLQLFYMNNETNNNA